MKTFQTQKSGLSPVPNTRKYACALGVALSLCMVASSNAGSISSSGVVGSIVKAPIAFDGDVAGAMTDFAINLNVDMDPSVPGKVLRSGESIRIQMPVEFKMTKADTYPVRDLFSAKDCVPGMLKCTAGVLLHGWPQHPILPSFPPGKKQQYTFTYDASTNTIIYTAMVDIDGVPLPGPGIKQIHPMLFAFQNPTNPGTYPIRVSFTDASGNETESGVGYLDILAKVAPSINITTVFVPGDKNDGNPPNPNIIYQKTTLGNKAPMPWDFLVWGANGVPYEGLSIEQTDDAGGLLTHDGQSVGSFSISAPNGASGQKVDGTPSVKIPGTPIIGKSFDKPMPAGRLTTWFTAGSKPGRYFTTFKLDGGNDVTMIVDVTG